MYAATGGPNVKWGGTYFKWGGREPLAPPLETVLRLMLYAFSMGVFLV